MSKTVLKLRPNDYWRIGEHESWFTDMAAKGLHLKKTGPIFAKFEKGKPKDMRYRIDVKEDRLTDVQKELYKEYGWEFVAKSGKFNVFSSPGDIGTPELHTDASEQSYTLEFLDKNYRQNVIAMSITILFIIGTFFTMLFLIKTPFLSIIEGGYLQQSLVIVINLYTFYSIIQASRSIRALRKSLFEGKPINHHGNWHKSIWIRRFVSVSFIIIAIATMVLPIMALTKMETYALPEGEIGLPIVRLEEIENNPDLERISYPMNDEVDWNNSIRYNWDPLATTQYDINEQGVVSSGMWKDGSGKYSPSISTQFYKLTFSGMAKGLVNDLIKRNLYRNDVEIQNVTHTDFDNLYIVEDNETKQIFASVGKNVLYLRYHGYADIEHIITLAAEKLSIASK